MFSEHFVINYLQQFLVSIGVTFLCWQPSNFWFITMPWFQAVCCEDKTHCCPKLTTCDLKNVQCRGKQTSPLMKKIHAVRLPQNSVVCPDHKSSCPDSYTCCPAPFSGYNCCPSPQVWCKGWHLVKGKDNTLSENCPWNKPPNVKIHTITRELSQLL